MKLRNIVGVLSLSTLGSCGLIDKNIGSLENNLTENFYDLSVKERYLLSRDEQRMDALWKFYIESSDEAIIDGDVNENIVLIKTPFSSSHGYMIDDCGLVLTVGHTARELSYIDLGNDFVFDGEGNKYSAKRTELSSYYRDYAIVVAETGKPQKTNPLNFPDFYELSCGSDVGFNVSPAVYTLSNILESSEKDSKDSDESFEFMSKKGRLLCVEHALEHIVNREPMLKKSHPGRILENQIRRGFYFVTSTVRGGDSGTPVFNFDSSENPVFLGLVQGNISVNNTDKRYMDNFGFVTGSDIILNAIGGYLDEHGKYDYSKILEIRKKN